MKGRKRQMGTIPSRDGLEPVHQMDLAFWPRVCKVYVDWGYRGLVSVAKGLGLELAASRSEHRKGVAHPYAGVRGGFSPS